MAVSLLQSDVLALNASTNSLLCAHPRGLLILLTHSRYMTVEKLANARSTLLTKDLILGFATFMHRFSFQLVSDLFFSLFFFFLLLLSFALSFALSALRPADLDHLASRLAPPAGPCRLASAARPLPPGLVGFFHLLALYTRPVP